jgi:TPR repeat protein
MSRITRFINQAVPSPGGNAFRHLSGRFLFAVFLGCVGVAMARADTLPNADYNHDAISRPFDVHDVSYRAHWIQSLRHRARQATQDHAPYLANRLWKQLAEAGDRDAAFRLGLAYDVGGAQERNAKLAVYWYRRAALAGEIHAQHNLGVAYAKGDGVSLDINLAIKWWTQAARRGNSDSQYNLGILYAAGEYGIKQDIEQAKHWWHKAAMHGDPMAQYNLGTLYVNNGVHNYCQATHWWKEAARNGVVQASLALRVIKTREDYRACH